MDRRGKDRRSGEDRREHQAETVRIDGLKGWWKRDSKGVHFKPNREEDKEASDGN